MNSETTCQQVKCSDAQLRASKNYHMKMQTDTEYKTKKANIAREYYTKNKDEVKAKQKERRDKLKSELENLREQVKNIKTN